MNLNMLENAVFAKNLLTIAIWEFAISVAMFSIGGNAENGAGSGNTSATTVRIKQ